MRENIGLYRGKRKDNGEWVEGYYVHAPVRTNVQCIDDYVIKHLIITSEGLIYEIIPETLGQYTGLNDKNRKNVFEGDILNCCSFSGTVFENDVVYWSDLFLMFKVSKHCLYGDSEQEYEIIGNIHDNPELLKGGVENENKP